MKHESLRHSILFLTLVVTASSLLADDNFARDKARGTNGAKQIAEHSDARKPVTVSHISVDTPKTWNPIQQNVESTVNGTQQRSIESLMVPVSTVTYDGDANLIWAPNPDGTTWDVLPVYYRGYGGPNTVPIIDLGSGQVKVENHPFGLNWHLCANVLAPNGNVYISTQKGRSLAICIYDPSKNELTLEAIPVPESMIGSETRPIVRSTDGMIFAGGGHTSRAASCIMIDPKDNSVTDFGSCGPSHAPTRCYNYYMGADDTHVYIASGKVPWYLVAVDRKTKQSSVLAKTANTGGIVVIEQETHGVSARVIAGPGIPRNDYWCHDGKLIRKSQPCPWGKTGTNWQKELPPKPEIYSERIVPPEPDEQAELWVRANVPNVVRGHEFPEWSRFKYDVPLYAMDSHRLIEMPDGRLLGTAGPYTGSFIYDPEDDQCSYIGKLHLSHYATVVDGNRIWMSGYPSSNLYVLDCTKPLNVHTHGAGPGTEAASHKSPASNPRMVGRLAESKCHKMYGAVMGAGGDLYFGGIWMRNGNGGGLGWWDPANNKETGIWEPFSNHQIAFLCAAGNGRYIVISTVRVGDLVLRKPKPKEGRLFIFDDAKKKIVREITVVKGVLGPGPIAWVGGNRVMGWTNDPASPQRSILYGVDVEKGEVAWKKSLPYRLPVVIGSNQKEPWDFRPGPDGQIWTFMGRDGKTLVRIDPQTAAVEGVTRVSKGGRLAFSGTDVYLSGMTYLRRIRGVSGRSDTNAHREGTQ